MAGSFIGIADYGDFPLRFPGYWVFSIYLNDD